MRIEPSPKRPADRHTTLDQLSCGELFSFASSDHRAGYSPEIYMKLGTWSLDRELRLSGDRTLIADQDDGSTRVIEEPQGCCVVRRLARLVLEDMGDAD